MFEKSPTLFMKFLLNLGLNAARSVRDVRRWQRKTVKVRDCVNFNGFLYRREAFHPFYSYLCDLEQHGMIVARQNFVEFLQFYRPQDAAQALGVKPLDKPQPLFLMPWDRFLVEDYHSQLCWRSLPMDCSDVLTRYSKHGLVSYLIEQEWFGIERALDSLRKNGYQTQRGFLDTRCFVRASGERRYLLLDGNHRAAAMTYLGWDEVEARIDTLREVREVDADKWWGVRKGFYTREAALALFNGYFNGNSRVRIAAQPTPVEAPAQWKEIYLPNFGATNGHASSPSARKIDLTQV